MGRIWIRGNDAVLCGAIAGGCRAFFGYPITPASEITQNALKFLPKLGGIAIQAESEVSAISMLYGAAATGSAAMTSTSGPGLSLMQEGLSYLAAARLPCVIVDIMRAGPGLGNISPEQTDFAMTVVGGGHGDYHMPVFAPNGPREMFEMTRDAFKVAFEYRTPVIILGDAFIGQMMELIDIDDAELIGAGFENDATSPSYKVGSDPKTHGNVVTSLELSPPKLKAKNDLRFAGYARMQEKLPRQELSPIKDADIIIVAYGIVSRVAREAVDMARKSGISVSLFRPQTLWPFPETALVSACKDSKAILCIELSRGQMKRELDRMLGPGRCELLSTDGGLLLTASMILEAIKRLNLEGLC